MSDKHTYPEAFLQRMQNKLGSEFDAFVESLDEPSPTSVRLNPFKPIGKFDADDKVSWCQNGRYLAERPSFTFDPLFHAGTYYVQEASSMFIEQAWQQINPGNQPVRVLDMCAAPGGKSTHLLSMMSEESLLLSNEIIPNRNKILQQNIVKWGTANCIVTQNKPEDFTALEGFFDIILIDAPCSGEGLFRKDKDAIAEWSERNVELCAIRQKDILEHAVSCLKPGGYLIYSTCTFEDVENDRQNSEAGSRKSEVIQNTELIQNAGIVKTVHGYQFYPHKVKGEGFYLSLVQKAGENRIATPELVSAKADSQYAAIFQQYLQQPDKFTAHVKNDMLFAIPVGMYQDFLFIEKHFYIRHAGLFMGTLKGKDFLPSHDLALSIHLKKDLPAIDINYDDAISYLRCETPKIKPDYTGWGLVTYQQYPLGWIKAMPGRYNNYFPKELRILKR
ncbi:MAG TPA: hypothetical protein VK154_15145 [Chitinophagales bacterium]|nr:hypothetical protein [Chitinophagales bacterium]